MQHLVENRIAALYQVQTELPTLSRPLYEVILTGTKACQNGVTHNFIIRRSHEVSIFELAKSQGLKTAAAAYSWISELYNRAPFEPYNDREQTDIRANAILDFGEIRTLFTVGTQTFPAQSVEVYGTKGIMTIEIPFNPYPDSPAKIRIQSKGQTRILELGPADQYQLEFDSFADAILNNRPVPTPPEDAIHNQRVLDALFQSAQTGQWQKVD